MLQAADTTTNASLVGNPNNSINHTLPYHSPSQISHRLLSLLCNHLVLDHIVPYLSAADRLNLAATNRSFRHLILGTTGVFRHLDLTSIKAAQFDIEVIDRGGQVWRNVQLDEYLTEDDFYGGPLRGIFSNLRRGHLLADVQTLILDGLSVTAELCHEIIHDSAFNVRVLSLRGAKNLNEKKLCGSLRHACRPSRPEGTPRLKALYIFGPAEPEEHALKPHSHHRIRQHASNPSSANARAHARRDAGEDWYHRKGRMIDRPHTEEWATTLVDCHGVIAFDALPCRGPRHLNSPSFGKYSPETLVTPLGSPRDTQWAVADHALPACAGCGAAPEGLVSRQGVSTPSELPLLSPPPVLASSLKACTTPSSTCASSASVCPSTSPQTQSKFVARCYDCLRDRYCAHCNKWWCEDCYVPPAAPAYQQVLQTTDVVVVSPDGDAWIQQHVDEGERLACPKPKARIIKSCWECGNNCHDCIEHTQRICRGCRGGYCIIHNEGSSATHLHDDGVWAMKIDSKRSVSWFLHEPPPSTGFDDDQGFESA